MFAPPLNIGQTFASNADVTIHEAQLYDVLTIFSSHLARFVSIYSSTGTHMRAKMFRVTGQAILASFVVFRERSNILFFLLPHADEGFDVCQATEF